MKKTARKRREKKKSILDMSGDDVYEYLSHIPEIIFVIFMIWLGYSISYKPEKNDVYQKFLKKSLINGRKYIDQYFPRFLANEKVFNIFDYDVLFIKTKEIAKCLGWLYMIGSLMVLIFSSNGRKILLFLALILDLALVHNLTFYKNENWFDIIKIVAYFIILLFL